MCTQVHSRHHASRAALGAVLAILILLSASGPAAAHPDIADGRDGGCHVLRLPVALGAGQPAASYVQGRLCQPRHARGDVVQVLVHGATYGGYYWDFPYRPERYSYVQWMEQRGYATFTFDRIGIGASSHPVSTLVNVYSNAHVLHQVVASLRAGLPGVRPFARVVTVGHSLGTLIVNYEAATYQDVNGVMGPARCITTRAPRQRSPGRAATRPARIRSLRARASTMATSRRGRRRAAMSSTGRRAQSRASWSSTSGSSRPGR